MEKIKTKGQIMKEILRLQKIKKEGSAGANIKGRRIALHWVIE